MSVNIYRDDNGYYFGRTRDGTMISLDLRYRGRDRTNGNIVASGMAGRGKTTALKHIIQSQYMAGAKIICIDPEREEKDLCRNLGGVWLHRINGLHCPCAVLKNTAWKNSWYAPRGIMLHVA